MCSTRQAPGSRLEREVQVDASVSPIGHVLPSAIPVSAYPIFTAIGECCAKSFKLETFMISPIPASIPAQATVPSETARDPRMWQAAKAMEASFLAEMLKSAGLDAAPGGVSAGPGQDQFATFLLEAQAERIVQAGGLGLAESIYESMKGGTGNDQ